MEKVIKELTELVKTPNKLKKLVLAPSYIKGKYDSHAVDCPFVFKHKNKFYMTFVGWDSKGYRTGLAVSSDLLTWEKKKMILGRGPKGSVTEYNAALTWIMRDNDLFGSGELKKVNGEYLGTYHAYPGAGYETGPAVIGLCRSKDLLNWKLEKPFLFPEKKNKWEGGGLYKSCLVENNGKYYMFYNAKNDKPENWREQIGVVVSSDLIHWKRSKLNPVLKNGKKGGFDDLFASEPCVLRYKKTWVMFYFGLCSDGHARESVAFSKDLIHWKKSNEVLVDVGKEGQADSLYAHKPSIFYYKKKLYHYYCAVKKNPSGKIGEIKHNEVRGIAVATD